MRLNPDPEYNSTSSVHIRTDAEEEKGVCGMRDGGQIRKNLSRPGNIAMIYNIPAAQKLIKVQPGRLATCCPHQCNNT